MTGRSASGTTLSKPLGLHAAADEKLHIDSHFPLLVDLSKPEVLPQPRRGHGAVDAVIVPTSRSAANLSLALARAQSAQCPLIVLCSGQSTAAAVIARLEKDAQSAVVAADVDHSWPAMLGRNQYGSLGLRLHTDALATTVGNASDVSYKRNLGLLIARVMGWRSVLFLDDDVFGLDDDEMIRGTGFLRGNHHSPAVSAVSWRFPSFEDNSSVCHAHRAAGGDQDVFVGSAALAVALNEDTPFFPNVYNEDWLFNFPLLARRRVGLAGDLSQLPFDPYDPAAGRAVLQEFGDTLAEGVFRLLHEGRPVTGRNWPDLLDPARDGIWWEKTIDRRRRFIQDIENRLDRLGSRQTLIRQTLAQAQRRHDDFSAELFVDFVRCWIDDSERWRSTMIRIDDRPRRRPADLPRTLKYFGIWSQQTLRMGRSSRKGRVTAGRDRPLAASDSA